MKYRRIGGRSVSAIGLGGMPMSIEGRPEDRSQSIATIHAALDAGITLIDTADAYHQHAGEVGHNEILIAEALASYGPGATDVLVATKGGQLRPGDGSWTVNGQPQYLKQAARESAKRLGVEAIALYQLHRPDPAVPYADSIGALRDLLDAGVIRQAGISNVSIEQVDIARDVLGDDLVSVQNQFSPLHLDSQPVLEYCTERGLAFLPWSPLGGIRRASQLGATQSVLSEIAHARGVSPYQVVLAWELSLAENVVPIPGASKAASIADDALAPDLDLDEAEIVRIENSLA
ncbi:MAG: aldo/keto reductase [Propionicimonas sp.]|uniref:aldo/keto reductase n=1 Tax=Propionicimonas sp. TaxID=1955623 RepID=UPI002B20953C|nr:aldo/keto reductase [Propionicimonas sp.]MEA4943365.1 aldo/keto reductase [Propionicimonas sp.]MEA5119164.1 aldo/keto reductase [Propionicimonas sp.]